MRNIVDIFRDVVSGLATTLEFDSITDNADGTFTIGLCNTKWIRPKSTKSLATVVTIDSVEYDVDSVVRNVSITVTSAVDLTAFTELSIAAPYYLNGTQLAVNKKRKGEQFSWNKFPFIWLQEPFVAVESEDRLSIIASQPELVIYILDEDNPQDMTTEDRYSDIIPMLEEIKEAFFEKIRTTRATFGRVTNKRVVRRIPFGKEAENGSIHSIIDEKSTGLDIRFTVEILKDLQCTNC